MINITRFIGRFTVLLSMLLAVSTVHADAKEDTARAETAIRTGDLIVAMGLLRQAVKTGYAPAQARLADLLDAAEQDAEAVALYRLAAAQNDPAGETGLARMLAQGDGVARDIVQALTLYRRAADKNHAPALDALARAHRAGELGLPRDLVEAARLEQRAKTLVEQARGAR